MNDVFLAIWENVDHYDSSKAAFTTWVAAVTEKELEFSQEYRLYDGPAIDKEKDKNYQIEWDRNATEITVVLQEEVEEWASEKECTRTYYQPISDEVTISLAEE